MIRIGLIGDFDPEVKAHIVIPQAIQLAADQLEAQVSYDWIATPTLESDVANHLKNYQAIWVVPASPYANMQGALNGIQFAREHGVPFLGTCGGFQHMLIEFALGLQRYIRGRSRARRSRVEASLENNNALRHLKTAEKAISGVSQRAEHWIGLGDMWIALTLVRGRPNEWVTEPDEQFDAAFTWCNRPYLLEYQHTPITLKQWASKWER